MHILKIIHGYPMLYNAGSEVYSQSVCNEMVKHHTVSVFTREENLYAPDFSIRTEQIAENLTLYIINNPQGKDGYRHQQIDDAFEQLVKQLQPNIAYIGHLNHLSTGIIDKLNCLKIPIVYMLHDFWLMCPRGQFLTRSIGKINNFQVCNGQDNDKCADDCYQVYYSGLDYHKADDHERWKQWIKNRMEVTKSIIEKVDVFIAPSRYLQNRFVSDFGMPSDKIRYIDYGFPMDYLERPLLKNECPLFTFGYIGTHIPAKGVNLLIEAFMHLKKPARLKIFGRNNGQSTKALRVMASKVETQIEFCDEYRNSDLVEKVFSHVDCIVVPSIWAENSPLVIHEAQACRIPIITANYGGMAEYVHHHENGLLFEHRSVSSLAEQMNWAMSHIQELKTYGQRGYLYSSEGRIPNITEHCSILLKLFQDVINQ